MKKLKTNNIIKALLIFIGLILIQNIAGLIVGIIFGIMLRGQQLTLDGQLALIEKYQSAMTLYISLIYAIVALIWCSILYVRSGQRNKKLNYSNVFSKKNLLGIIACSIAGAVFLSMLLTIISNLFPSDTMLSYTNHMEILGIGASWVSLIYTVFIGPAAEEIIFRGAIFDRFNRAFSFWVANVLQALLFGIYHFNLIQGIYAFLIGIVFGMIIHVTGSIYASIITHMLFNATSYVLQCTFNLSGVLLMVVVIASLVVCGIIYVSGICYFARRCKIQKQVVQEDIKMA